MAQKTDKCFEAQHGKKPNQKLKPYLVQQYLLKNTDEDHVASAYKIVDFLELCGIPAERRSTGTSKTSTKSCGSWRTNRMTKMVST